MKTKLIPTFASAVVIVTTCLVQTIPANASTSSGQGATFHYVDGSVIGIADGASVQIDQARPVIGPAYHSLIELAVESLDSSQIVEVGWTVDKELNGDDLPHLFVFHWVDGAPTCYNGCGFVQIGRAHV